MPGRPPSSYCFPRIWLHVESLGFVRSERALKSMRTGFSPPMGTTLSNSLFETKFKPEAPKLFDYNTAHDVVALINYQKQRSGNDGILNPAEEIVRFCYRLIPSSQIAGQREGEHGDLVGKLVAASDLPEDVIMSALAGRLLPERICVALAKASNGQLSIESTSPGPKATPESDSRIIKEVFNFFEVAA